MGVDCSLWVDGKEIERLNRWHVFMRHVKSGKEYSRQEALKLIEQCRELPEWGSKEYYEYWTNKAEEVVKRLAPSDKIVWYIEGDEPETFDYLLGMPHGKERVDIKQIQEELLTPFDRLVRDEGLHEEPWGKEEETLPVEEVVEMMNQKIRESQ